MDNSNRVKIGIIVVVVVIVVVATFLYGNAQRNKNKEATNQKANLPSVSSADQAKAGDAASKPQLPQQNTPSAPNPAPAQPSPTAKQNPVQPNVPSAKTPATGAGETLLPAVVLGFLSGLYLVSRRAKSRVLSLQSVKNQV